MGLPVVTQDFDTIRIHFGDVLHLSVSKPDLLGVHSWRFSDRNFSIEYVMRGATMLTEYDDEAKWRAILSQLEKII
jgi:hypothetical protein